MPLADRSLNWALMRVSCTTSTLARLGSATLISIEGGTRFDKGKRYIDHLRAISAPILAALSR